MTQDQPPSARPPPRRPIYDVLPPRCLGRLITIAIVALVSLFTILSQERNHSIPPSSTPSPLQLTAFPDAYTTPPTDTVTITLTWDEWQDIGDCINEVRGEITVTLDFAGHTLPPDILAEARSTYNRLGALADKLLDDAEAQTHHIPGDQMILILDHQMERCATFLELTSGLFEARMNLLLPPTPQPKKDK